jgi:hypothetical protein
MDEVKPTRFQCRRAFERIIIDRMISEMKLLDKPEDPSDIQRGQFALELLTRWLSCAFTADIESSWNPYYSLPSSTNAS